MRYVGQRVLMDLLPVSDLRPGLHQAHQQPWQVALVPGPLLPLVLLGPVWAQRHNLCAGLGVLPHRDARCGSRHFSRSRQGAQHILPSPLTMIFCGSSTCASLVLCCSLHMAQLWLQGWIYCSISRSVQQKVGHAPPSAFEALLRAGCHGTSRLESFPEWLMSDFFCNTEGKVDLVYV